MRDIEAALRELGEYRRQLGVDLMHDAMGVFSPESQERLMANDDIRFYRRHLQSDVWNGDSFVCLQRLNEWSWRR